jgi:Purple acid Phosphatase, N-terminal domain/Calcineurin-like phosphoesterase
MKKKQALFLLALALVLLSVLVVRWKTTANAVGPLGHVLLTWRSEDTSRTITVLYQTQDSPGASQVLYDTASCSTEKECYRFQQSGTRDRFEELNRTIHTVELTGLQPATTYYFVIADAHRVRSKEMKFRTLPADDSAIRIVAGGDMGTTDEARALSMQAAKLDPDLAIAGGDIAYANGKLGNAELWDQWLRDWTETMITADGRLIPLIAAIGNHEVNPVKGASPAEKAPFYLRYLHQDDANGTYFSRSISANIGLVVLDSTHLHRADGPQKAWLEQQLERYRDLRYRIAVYHRPLYPGGRYPGYEPGEAEDLIRAWLPAFDRFHLTLGLENHYHTHKRTKVLAHNAVSKDGRGTVYLGDGAWGQKARDVVPDLWYLEKAFSKNHIWIVDVSAESITFQAIDADGNRFDYGIISFDDRPPVEQKADAHSVLER